MKQVLNGRDKSIDGMRGIMISLIVLLHSCQFGIQHETGTIANIFFFSISGYLLYGSMCIKQTPKISLVSYLKHRIGKIYLIYLVSLVFEIIIYGRRPIIDFLMNVTLTCSGWFVDDCAINGPTWFFSVITFVYILFFFVARFTQRKYNRILVLIISATAYFLSTLRLEIPFLYGRMLIGIAAFFFGCVLREVIELIGNRDAANKEAKGGFSLVDIVGIVATVLTVGIIIGLAIVGHERLLGAGLFGFVYIFIPAIIYMTTCFKYAKRVLSIKPLAFIGKNSMYLFIWHVPVVHLFRRFGWYDSLNSISVVLFETIYLLVLAAVIWSNKCILDIYYTNINKRKNSIKETSN